MMQPGMQAGIGMGPQRPPQMQAPQGMQGMQGMQAPPPGGPQMPPPQPGMVGPQGPDPQAMLAQMKAMSPQQLQQMVQAKHPLGSFALVMLNGRNEAIKAEKAKQAQQIAAQPPVAQRVMQESQQLGGVAALPTGQAIPQQYAQGGVVGFYEGGDVTAEGEYLRLMRTLDPYTSMYGVSVDTPQGMPPGFGRTEGSGISRDIRNMYSGSVAGEIDRRQAERYRAEGRDADAIPLEVRPPVSPAYRMEGANVPVRGVSSVGAAPPVARSASPSPRPGAGSGSGIASLAARNSGEQLSPWKDPRIGAPPASLSDAEWVAEAKKMRDEMAALYGPSYADKYLKELIAEREQLKAREPRAREEAWLTAGLRMMQGKSRHGVQNIGAGGEAGIAQYRADRTMNDEQQRALRREMMGLEASEQQRKDAMVQAGIGRADRRDAQLGQARSEHMDIRKGEMEYGVKGAQLAIDSRKADAMMMSAGADMKRAAAALEANGLVKEANSITATRGKIDAAVKVRVAAIENTLIGKNAAQIKLAIDQIEREEYTKELNRNPKFAELMGVGGKGTVSARSAGLD